MKQLKQILFWLLLALGTTALVFTSCKDDEPETTDNNTDTGGTTVSVTGVSLTTTTLSLLEDSTYTLTVTVSPSNATNQTVTWTTSDASIATVSNGIVTAVAAGTVTITAKAGDITATCTITITENSNTQINSDGVTGTVTDAQGNSYKIVKIGNQWWMAENLKVTTYNDGTAIPNVTDATAWAALTTGAYCSYNNDADNATKYGMLYNWYAVNTGKLAPAGWHVPTNAEWTTLNTYVSSNYGTSGSVAKALAATTDWTTSTTTGAPGNTLSTNNSTGFFALPGGYRNTVGSFYGLGNLGIWWSATEYSSTNARNRNLNYNNSNLNSNNNYKENGFSVRCVRDLKRKTTPCVSKYLCMGFIILNGKVTPSLRVILYFYSVFCYYGLISYFCK